MASFDTNRCDISVGSYGIRLSSPGGFSFFGVLGHKLSFDEALSPAGLQVEICKCGVNKVGAVLCTGYYKSIIPSSFVI